MTENKISRAEHPSILTQVAVVLHDAHERVLLQAQPNGKTWRLPTEALQPRFSILEAVRRLVERDLGTVWVYEEYLGTYSDHYTLQLESSERKPLLLIAVCGIVSEVALHAGTGPETIGRRFFGPRELPIIAERAHLDMLTDYFAGRRGVLR